MTSVQVKVLADASITTMLVVKNAVRQFVPDDYQVSHDFYEALSEEVENIVARAGERAEANGRSTLKPRDL